LSDWQEASFDMHLCILYKNKLHVPFVVKKNHFSSVTYHQILRLVTWQVPLVEKKLLTIPNNMISTPICSGIRVAKSVLYNMNQSSLLYWSFYCLLMYSFWLAYDDRQSSYWKSGNRNILAFQHGILEAITVRR